MPKRRYGKGSRRERRRSFGRGAKEFQNHARKASRKASQIFFLPERNFCRPPVSNQQRPNRQRWSRLATVNFLGGGRRDAAKVEFRRPSFLLLRRQDDRLRMELNRVHLRDGFLFALERGPEIAKDEVAVLHERGMNRQAPDAATVI